MKPEINGLIFELKISEKNQDPANMQDFFSSHFNPNNQVSTSKQGSEKQAIPSGKITLNSDFSTNDCIFAKESFGTNWILCRPEPPPTLEKYLPLLPGGISVVIALVALYFSSRTLFYNINKDDRARKQSIQDDFWLRKVVSPSTIEPFFLYTNGLREKLPSYKDRSNSAQQAVKKFSKENSKKLNSLSLAFGSLGLIDPELARDISKDFEKFEDNISTYIENLGFYLENKIPEAPDHVEVIDNAQSLMQEILLKIQLHQTKLGQPNNQNASFFGKLFRRNLDNPV